MANVRVECRHPTCNCSFESHESMKQHFLASHDHSQAQQRYACKLCNRFFPKNEGLQDHMRSCHLTAYETQAAPTEIAPPVILPSSLHHLQLQLPMACNDCGRTFKTADSLHQHQWASPDHTRVSKSPNPNHGTLVRTCSQCSLELPTAADLEQHFVEQHPSAEVYPARGTGPGRPGRGSTSLSPPSARSYADPCPQKLMMLDTLGKHKGKGP